MSEIEKNHSVCDRSLEFSLVPGEIRVEVSRSDGAISAAFQHATSCGPRGTLVLIHGVASNASRWEEFVEKADFRCSWNVVRLDLRAHGASVSASIATLEKHAEDLIALLNELQLESAVWVGHSLGAQIAMMTAVLHPERTDGLILLDPLITEALTSKAASMKKHRFLLVMLERLGRFLNALGFRRRLASYSLRRHDEKARQMLALGGEALEAFIKEYSSPWRDLNHIHFASYMRDLLEVLRPNAPIEELDLPVLVLASRNGAFTDPEKMAIWTSRMPGASFDAVPCAHWPLTECPDQVSDAMKAWLKKIFP